MWTTTKFRRNILGMEKYRVLCVIPARGGSKRIKNKNIRSFAGKSLIIRTIEQARALPFIDRIVVDTDSLAIAKIAQAHKAEVPYLRPKHLASDKSQIVDSILYLLGRLKDEKYVPDYIVLLQTTSPLREVEDIEKCWTEMKKGGTTTILTVASTHPQLYYLDSKNNIYLANRSAKNSSNTQDWPKGYLLNGCFVYVIQTKALLKEKQIMTRKTRAVISPRWRSVDLDTPEDWVMAEMIHKNKQIIEKRLKNFT